MNRRNLLKSTGLLLSGLALSRLVTAENIEDKSVSLEYLPSHANFIFHRIEGSSLAYQEKMKQHHIYVGRPFALTDGWSRLTLGTPEQMNNFVGVLKVFRRQGWV